MRPLINMMWIIECMGRTYGPFRTRHDAQVYAAQWLSDFRYTIMETHE
jgi:hypothetical protein